MTKKRPEFKVGDSIVVKPATADPDFGINIGGWQGRISGIDADKKGQISVSIQWDSITLKNMPGAVIEQCEERGLAWTEIVLAAKEVELTTPRDTEEDVAKAVAELATEYAWSYLGEQGKRIRQALVSVDPDHEMAALEAWEEYLEEHLAFPFVAKVDEWQDRGPLQAGDRVKVTGIGLVDDLYGIIVDLKHGRRKYAFPLCDLEVVDEDSPNYQIIRDYRVWFANR
jgi:hypothetical protein